MEEVNKFQRMNTASNTENFKGDEYDVSAGKGTCLTT